MDYCSMLMLLRRFSRENDWYPSVFLGSSEYQTEVLFTIKTNKLFVNCQSFKIEAYYLKSSIPYSTYIFFSFNYKD